MIKGLEPLFVYTESGVNLPRVIKRLMLLKGRAIALQEANLKLVKQMRNLENPPIKPVVGNGRGEKNGRASAQG